MEWNFILRLCVAGLCGTVIGLDREYRVKDAGFRTHFLVALGSALMMIVSQYGFAGVLGEPGVGLDPSRIAAQVVSGIGFIGAGTIIIHRQLVRGLTTAASLWATAGIGLTAGSGMFLLAGVATVLTLFGLEVLSLVFGGLGRRRTMLVFSAARREVIDEMFNALKTSDYSSEPNPAVDQLLAAAGWYGPSVVYRHGLFDSVGERRLLRHAAVRSGDFHDGDAAVLHCCTRRRLFRSDPFAGL